MFLVVYNTLPYFDPKVQPCIEAGVLGVELSDRSGFWWGKEWSARARLSSRAVREGVLMLVALLFLAGLAASTVALWRL